MLGWSYPVERFAWSAVESLGDVLEVDGGVDGQVGALGEVLAQQPVGVLVDPALPGGVRIAEEDLDLCVD